MIASSIIIAHRRRGNGYWEGYVERPETEAKEWLSYYRNIDRIAKIFSNMAEYRADCNKRLDKWGVKRTCRTSERR